MDVQKLINQINDLSSKCEALKTENEKLKGRIEAYVGEFRVCRFCVNLHADCSPKDESCRPKWGGL